MIDYKSLDPYIFKQTHEEGDCVLLDNPTKNKVFFNDTSMTAKRAVYMLAHGEPVGNVKTTCGNKHCVRPEHLVDSFDRAQLLRTAKRATDKRFGEKAVHAKLTSDNVRTIRSMFPSTPDTVIAKLFNVSGHTIWNIRNGVTWKETV